MVENSQQKSTRGQRKNVNEVSHNNDMVKQLVELTRQVQAIALLMRGIKGLWCTRLVGFVENMVMANVCAHAVDPITEYEEQGNALKGFQP